MVMWAILKNVKIQDFWINLDGITFRILHLSFDILHKMNRIASNEVKILELSVSRPLQYRPKVS